LFLSGSVYVFLSQRERIEVREKKCLIYSSPLDQVRGRL